MSDEATVTETEHGLVRVFQASYQLSMEIGHVGTYDMLCREIGIEKIGYDDVQQVGSVILETMPLSEFLIDAYEVDPAEIAPHADKINAISDMALLIRSSAFLDRPVTLKTDGHAKLIATFSEPNAMSKIRLPLTSESATGVLTSPPAKKKPSDAAMGGRVATIALIVMALLVWVMIKVAG